MITVLILIALKSLLVALLTLGLLQLLRNRSAAERSWIAHVGLLALIIMALAPLVLPKWRLETPLLLGHAKSLDPNVEALQVAASALAPDVQSVSHLVARPATSAFQTIDAAAAITAIYAIPAAILLAITLLALLRLFALRARAEVLVDGHWLSALARAQRRMGFKHGTALLTSNELVSPISWGLMRPVILLSSNAVEASDEAEAIIAHELAHVARMDWMKLLLARLATAMFWFNPLVWLLAREAHQLREEAADDSVLASDILDTDYAQLLVGVARHGCPGLLLGAHGVAPSRNSLARRVARVLDGKSVRSPVARSFGLTVFAGAVLVAAPLAALTIAPPSSRLHAPSAAMPRAGDPQGVGYSASSDIPTDLPHLIMQGVTTSVGTATAAIVPEAAKTATVRVSTLGNAADSIAVRGHDGPTVKIDLHGSMARPTVIASTASGATAISFDADRDAGSHGISQRHSIESAVNTAIEMKAMAVTPEFVAAMRAASPSLRSSTLNEIVGLKAVGVTPDYVREIVDAGFVNMRVSEIEEARAVGLSPQYMRAMREAGAPLTLNELIELRSMGIQPSELARIRTTGTRLLRKTHRTGAAPTAATPPRPPTVPFDGG